MDKLVHYEVASRRIYTHRGKGKEGERKEEEGMKEVEGQRGANSAENLKETHTA
jgi:hypothetical protein